MVASALVGCGRSDTGVHIHARVGSLEYDELQFRVTRPAGEVVVDPTTAGRYQGPFRPGDQDVIVYLRDDLGGSQLHCDASALSAGAVVATGAGDVTVVRGELRDVEIFMAPPGGGGGTSGGGSSGGAGTTGEGGTTGGGGSSVVPGKSNGEACSLDAECLTAHCADGVCCESECKMACRSCGLPESKGLCRPVAGGAPDPRGMCHDEGAASCKRNGLCAVDGTCAVYPAGAACAPVGCEGAKAETVVPAGLCDGVGKCVIPEKIKCGAGAMCVAGVCTDGQLPKP